MEDLSLHILDIAENSIKAGARNIEIIITEDAAKNMLTVEINDDGRGMQPAEAAAATDPFYTTRTTRRVGLGLAFLDEAAKAAGGEVSVRSSPGAGTKVKATFRLHHIDRKPLGNMAETVVALLAGHPEIDLSYTHTSGGRSAAVDTKQIRRLLGGMPADSAAALGFIREYLDQEEKNLSH